MAQMIWHRLQNLIISCDKYKKSHSILCADIKQANDHNINHNINHACLERKQSVT